MNFESQNKLPQELSRVNSGVGSPVILLVEDEAAIRLLITRMLRRHGFQVLTAAAASDGQALFDKHHEEIALVVVDMFMPGISGLDLAASLERTHPAMKILYISGYVGSIAIDSIRRRSSEAVLCKPFTKESLLRRVRQLVGQSASERLVSEAVVEKRIFNEKSLEDRSKA